MECRTFLGAAMAAFPLTRMGQSIKTTTQAKAVHVSSGEDRFGEHRTLGVSSTNFKVSTQDSSGGLFIEVPHVWAFVGDTADKLLMAFAPANKMEEYFRRILQTRGGAYSNPNNAQQASLKQDNGLQPIGPPLGWG
jgi:hypothetical protein